MATQWARQLALGIGLALTLALPAMAQEPSLASLVQDAHSPEVRERWRAIAALQWREEAGVADALIAALTDPDVQVRRTAARALGPLGDRRATPALITALGDAEHKVASRAAEALGQLKDPAAIAPLLQHLQEDQWPLYDATRTALRSMSAVALPAVVELLQHPKPRVREWAAETLGCFPDAEALPPLIGAQNDPDRQVRSRVASMLGNRTEPLAAKALLATFPKERDETTRRAMVSGLMRSADPDILTAALALFTKEGESLSFYAQYGIPRCRPAVLPVLLKALESPNGEIRAMAATTLTRLRDPRAIPALVQALASETRVDEDSVDEALITAFGEQAIPELRKAVAEPKRRMRALGVLARLHDSWAFTRLCDDLHNPQRRESAILALGTLGDRRAVPALIALMSDPDPWIYDFAVEALGALKDPRALPVLLDTLKADSESLRATACRALGQIGDPRVIEPLAAKLQSQSEEVRQAASEALMGLCDPRVVSVLARQLQAKEADRWSLAQALANIGDAGARDALYAALPTAEGYILGLLTRLRDPRALNFARAQLTAPEPGLRAQAVKTLGEFAPPDAAQLIVSRLSDAEWPVTEKVEEALVRLKDPATADALLACLGEPRMRTAAVRALGALRERRAASHCIAFLETEWKDPDLRAACMDALGEIGDPAAVPVLLAALRDDHSWPGDRGYCTAAHAARALGQLKARQAIGPITRCLQEPPNPGRGAMITALGMIGDVHVLDTVSRFQQDADVYVRMAALTASVRLGQAEEFPRLVVLAQEEKDIQVRMAVMQAVATLEEPQVNAQLLAWTRDTDLQLVNCAIVFLAQRREQRVVPLLLERLTRHELYERTAAAEWLRVISGQDFGLDTARWLTWWETVHPR
jgi:HEAT repeat protein